MTCGVVVIGRNEGERLARCLGSLAPAQVPVVYVDSGSTDASVALARGRGAGVVELDRSTRFSAARARNAGFELLCRAHPQAAYVQFVDGDCELAPGWLARARQELEAHPELAVVCGRLRERHPEASIYQRLCDLEWDAPPGEVLACGGIFMARVSALAAVGGFDPTVLSGEEPELCCRLRRRGGKVVRLPDAMGVHDADMTRLAQWWRRQVRNGYGFLDVVTRFAHVREDGLYVRAVQSARAWTLGWLSLLGIGVVAGLGLGGPRAALAVSAGVCLLPCIQAVRVALAVRDRVGSVAALAYGVLIVAGKWAELGGQFRWWRERGRGWAPGPSTAPPPPARPAPSAPASAPPPDA